MWTILISPCLESDLPFVVALVVPELLAVDPVLPVVVFDWPGVLLIVVLGVPSDDVF